MAENIIQEMTNLEQQMLIDEFVDHLPAMRRRYSLSQEELGRKVGLSRQSVSAIERKTVALTWNTYLSFMMFFAANCNCLFYFPNRSDFKHADIFERLLKIEHNKQKEEIR